MLLPRASFNSAQQRSGDRVYAVNKVGSNTECSLIDEEVATKLILCFQMIHFHSNGHIKTKSVLNFQN